MSHTSPNAYQPLILEYRDTAVAINENITIWNDRAVLTEIPDSFNKVYIGGYTEIEKGSPIAGEYIVDYRTGITTFGGNVADGTIVSANYYGKGIIRYPADRIYAHTKDAPNVEVSLQEILDSGQQAIDELNKIGEISERLNHTTLGFTLGNNDWTPLAYYHLNGQINYQSAEQGVEYNGKNVHTKIRLRLPVDPESKYYLRAKATKTVGDGTFYIGAVSLDQDYNEINTDGATSYNYFGAIGETITEGASKIFEGTISGYNLTTESNHNKFDPEARYFDIVIIANYNGIADITRTVIDWLEVYRVPNELNVNGDANITGNMLINGISTFQGISYHNANIDMNNNSIVEVQKIEGKYGNMMKSTDEWLRLNDGQTHTAGIYAGTSLVRTDGSLQIGSAGATFHANGSVLTYKGSNIGVADGTLQVNLNADMLDGLDQSVFMRKSANSDLTFGITAGANSNGIVWSGVTDIHSIYVEETSGGETTNLVIHSKDNGTDGVVFKNTSGSVTNDVLYLDYNEVTAHQKLYANSGVAVTGLTTTGTLYASGNIIVDNGATGQSPAISLAIGDSDTGLNWISDGNIAIMANNVEVGRYSSTQIKFNKNVDALAGLDVTGNATVSGTLDIGTTKFTNQTDGSVRVSNSNGYIDISPKNTSYAHIYTDIGRFLFNRDVWSMENAFSSYNGDLALQNQGSTKLLLGSAVSIFSTNLTVDNGATTTVTIQSDDTGESILNLVGDAQGTGRVYVGQSTSYGGGFEYNGDGTPTSGGITDAVSFFRRSAGVDTLTAYYMHSSNDWRFKGNATVDLSLIATGLDINGNADISGTLNAGGTTLTSLTVNGITSINGSLSTGNYAITTGHINITDAGTGEGIDWDGTDFGIHVSDSTDTSNTVFDHLTFRGTGTAKFWMPVRSTGDVVADGSMRADHLTIGSGGEIRSEYNNSYFIKDHANGNVTLSATGANLYLGYMNTNNVWLRSTMQAHDGVTARTVIGIDGKLYYQGQDTDVRYINTTGDTMTGFLTLHADPTNALHAVTKQYVDAVKQALTIKDAVRVGTTANIDLTLGGALIIDGVQTAVGDRVLVKNQTTASQNGIYAVQTGAWTRATDFDENADVQNGAFTFIEEGTVNANMGYVLATDGTITVGTTALTFTQFSGAGQVISGTGLYKSGNEIGIANTGVTAGTYFKTTVNAQGQVTGGSNPTTVQGFGITNAIRTDVASQKIETASGHVQLHLDTNTSGYESALLLTEQESHGLKIFHEGTNNINYFGSLASGTFYEAFRYTRTDTSQVVRFASRPNVAGVNVLLTSDEGHGGGIDSDTVDGKHSTDFILRDGTQSMLADLDMAGYKVKSGNHYLILGSAGWTKNNGETVVAGEIAGDATGNARFMFTGHNGKINVYADGEFYANEGQYKVLHTGDEGHGKGIDADTIDTVHASQLMRSDIDTRGQNILGKSFGNDDSSLHLATVGGGGYATSTSTITGAIKITLPQSWTSTMMRFAIDVYEYTTEESFTVYVGGYNYNSTSDGWHNAFAQIVANNTNRDFTVRFAHDGAKCTVFIGELGSTWSYPQIRVRDFVAGFNNYQADMWNDGWSVGFETTSFGTVYLTRSNNFVTSSYAKEAGNANTLDNLDSSQFLRDTTSYVGLDLSGSTSYPRMVAINSGATYPQWLRVGVSGASSGLIPYADNDGFSKIGTSSWRFDEMHSMDIYAHTSFIEGGVALSTKYFRANASNGVDVRLASGNGRGMRFWDSDTYKIYMSATSDTTWGGNIDGTGDYNMYFAMGGGTSPRGFVFKASGSPVTEITGNGDISTRGNLTVLGNNLTFTDTQDHHKINLTSNYGGVHTLGTESYYNTYGGGTNTWTNGHIAHKFYDGRGNLIANIGYGGSGTPSNRLDSFFAGNVGIGTTATHALDVSGDIRMTSGSNGGIILESSTADSPNIRFKTTATSGRFWNIDQYSDSSDLRFLTQDSSNSTGDVKVTFRENGNVGIGITPAYKLDVNGTGRFSSKLTVLNDFMLSATGTSTDSPDIIFLKGDGTQNARVWSINNALNISTGDNTPDLSIDSLGNTIINGFAKISKNRAQVVFSAGQTTQTVTHNFGNTNYSVALGTDSFARHVKWTNKQTTTVDIILDEAHTEAITVDIILMPF